MPPIPKSETSVQDRIVRERSACHSELIGAATTFGDPAVLGWLGEASTMCSAVSSAISNLGAGSLADTMQLVAMAVPPPTGLVNCRRRRRRC
jgi:hypothetical protein